MFWFLTYMKSKSSRFYGIVGLALVLALSLILLNQEDNKETQTQLNPETMPVQDRRAPLVTEPTVKEGFVIKTKVTMASVEDK
jgi:hypothetical protein